MVFSGHPLLCLKYIVRIRCNFTFQLYEFRSPNYNNMVKRNEKLIKSLFGHYSEDLNNKLVRNSNCPNLSDCSMVGFSVQGLNNKPKAHYSGHGLWDRWLKYQTKNLLFKPWPEWRTITMHLNSRRIQFNKLEFSLTQMFVIQISTVYKY